MARESDRTGTVGDGDPHSYPTLSAAYLALTGEPLRFNAPSRDELINALSDMLDLADA